MRRHPTFFALSFLVLCAPSLPAAAQSAPPSPGKLKSEAATDKARELYNDGLKAYRAGQWEKARVAFLASWALAPHYQIAANLGDCELKTGHFRDAAEHAAFYAREMPADLSRAEKDGARALLEQARAKIGTLHIHADLEGAEVFVDAEHVGRAPLTEAIFVEPGSHVVEARLGVRSSLPTPVDVAAGASAEIALQVKWPETPRALAPSVSAAPVIAPPVPVPAPRRTASTGILVAGGVAAGVGLVTGIVATVVANGKASDAETARGIVVEGGVACPNAPGCEALRTELSSWASLRGVAIAGYVGAGALGVATVTYAILAGRSAADGNAKSSLRIVPIVDRAQAGVSIQGTF
jgi:hypothetical protein